MSKIPLKTRKSIKTALEAANAHVKTASEAFGKELTFIDNTSELFEKLQAQGKSEDWLFDLGKHITPYVEQFAKMMVAFCKNPDNKEQLEAELTTGKFGVRIVDGSTSEEYWALDEGTLWMETKPGWFSNYIDYYDAARLERKLGKSDAMPLNTRKSLKEAHVIIEKAVQEASKLFGKELTWVDNFQELYDKLKVNKSPDYLWKLGEPLILYPKQLVKTFTVFCKDPDNKEALEEVLTSGKVGVRIVSSDKSDVYWSIEDGTLWMDAKEGWFGNYIEYYDSDRLEKKL